MDIQESSREDKAKLNFLGVIWESKRSWRADFQAFREPKIQNFGNHGATSGIYWVYYKPPILSYWEVGTYDKAFCSCSIKPELPFIFFLHCHNFLNIRKELFNHTKTIRWNLLQLNEDQWIKWGSSESYGFTDSSF